MNNKKDKKDDKKRRLAALRTLKKVMGQREEILEAFIAKYGFDPDKICQVEQRCGNGMTIWYCRKLEEGEATQPKGRIIPAKSIPKAVKPAPAKS